MTSIRRVLITGASGYLGTGLLRRIPKDWETAATYLTKPIRSDQVAAFSLDIRDSDAVSRLVENVRPEIILHLAALMQGDAMSDVNQDGTYNVAVAAARAKARLIHISSDVIFDGEHAPYTEQDPPRPVSPYGATKALAELAVRQQLWNAVIVRTSLIYGFDPVDPHTQRTITGGMPHLFTDEYRCPIYVDDLCSALIELAGLDYAGILNIAGPQRLSRYEFGQRLAKAFRASPTLIPSLSSSSPDPRPRDCSLNTSLAQQILHTHLRSVDEVLASVRPS